MKLFGRTSGYYMFWTSFIYFWVGMYLAFTHSGHTEYASLGFVLALSVPLIFPPVARYFNMEPVMFDFFGKKDKSPSNVVPFPEPKLVPPMPQVEPPKKEEPVTTFYRLGFTSNDRVSFQMGYSEITMNYNGINDMIKQLEVFRDQLAVREAREEDE